jgi:hypothetical protein
VTLDDLVDDLNAASVSDDGPWHVMLNVAGRWTGIKGISADAETGTLFIESED